jgi:cytochrome P450
MTTMKIARPLTAATPGSVPFCPAPAPRVAPGPRGLPLLGSALQLARDPRLALLAWAREHGPMVRIPLGPAVAYMVAHPEGVKHVLQTRADNYHKATQTRFLTEFLGLSMLTLEGDAWQRRRRLAQPAFHKERLAEVARAMTSGAERMLARWRCHAGSGRSFDVAAEMMRVTLGVAGETLLGVDLSASAEDVARALPVVLDHVHARSMSVLPLPLWVPTPQNRRYHAARRVLDTLVGGLIRAWRSGRATPTGLMAMIMDARDEETGEPLGDEELRNEVMTLIVAGHETTAAALSWTFWLLAQNPAAARRLREELAEVLGDRAPTVQDLPRLSVAANTVKEAMRLMPPAWVIGRTPLADDEIGGYHVPAGSLVLLAPCVTHRDPSLWDDPETFDPDRFTPERAAGRHRMAYYPFSDGPRVCIGKAFSMMEATLVLAMVAQRYRLELDRARPVEIHASLTLRPKNGLWMTLREEARPSA